MNRARAQTRTVVLPVQPAAAEVEGRRAPPGGPPPASRNASGPHPAVDDLRAVAHPPAVLRFGPRDVVVVTGLPGSGKSTLMRRTVAGTGARVDSQDSRERWENRIPRFLPYALYRPLVRLAHYAGLRRALRAGTGVVVHDCGTQTWVRGWLTRAARRRGGAVHLLFLDVTAEEARQGQRRRGRAVSRYAFRRHRALAARLRGELERGRLPRGCATATLLDRASARVLGAITFGG